MNTHKYGIIDFVINSDNDHLNPVRDCRVMVDFSGPSGGVVSVFAFWDGGRAWRVRFSPEEVGEWVWTSRCVVGEDSGLGGLSGSFQCSEYQGENALYQHGPLKLSDNRQALVHEDGRPFFWLADTAWNGVIRGDDENWREYLSVRADQRFSVIQFVASEWRSAPVDEAGETSYFADGDSISINVRFFQRMDRRVAMINEFGFVASPVVLWSLIEEDPGFKLSEAAAELLASYVVSRYDAYQVVWILGGDGNYRKIGIDRWKRLGRSVFSFGHNRLSTLHDCGQDWVGELFRDEDWYDIVSYQSGHGDCEDHLRWLVEGPPASSWEGKPALPVINMEPNYETSYGFQHKTVFTDYHVRRAAYWSLLVSPTAGVSYGHDSIWNWNSETGPSLGHGDWHDGAVPPWREGLNTDGIRNMTLLRGIFERMDWASLTPYQSVLVGCSNDETAAAFVAAARTASGTVVIYAPLGGTVGLAPGSAISGPLHFVDPRTGDSALVSEELGNQINFPDDRDWLAVSGGE